MRASDRERTREPYSAPGWESVFADTPADARDCMLGMHGVVRFSGIAAPRLNSLIEGGFVADMGNCCPKASAFLAFMQSHPAVTAHGFVKRHKTDPRESVTIEGIALQRDVRIEPDTLLEFAMFVGAYRVDEIRLEDNSLMAWWN